LPEVQILSPRPLYFLEGLRHKGFKKKWTVRHGNKHHATAQEPVRLVTKKWPRENRESIKKSAWQLITKRFDLFIESIRPVKVTAR
jgi:hypothetical protein